MDRTVSRRTQRTAGMQAGRLCGGWVVLLATYIQAGEEPTAVRLVEALFQQKQWPEYVAAAEQTLKGVSPARKSWHAASRLALAAKLAKDERQPAAIAEANLADAPTAKAVFLGITELLDGDTRNVAVLAEALR